MCGCVLASVRPCVGAGVCVCACVFTTDNACTCAHGCVGSTKAYRTRVSLFTYRPRMCTRGVYMHERDHTAA